LLQRLGFVVAGAHEGYHLHLYLKGFVSAAALFLYFGSQHIQALLALRVPRFRQLEDIDNVTNLVFYAIQPLLNAFDSSALFGNGFALLVYFASQVYYQAFQLVKTFFAVHE
jgi:hypothetical protein